MRYKHNQEDNTNNNSPKKSTSFNNKVVRSGSKYSLNGTPRRKRASHISVSRPTSFQYKSNPGAGATANRNSVARHSVASRPTILLVNHHTSHHTDHLIDHHINRLLRDIHIINPN